MISIFSVVSDKTIFHVVSIISVASKETIFHMVSESSIPVDTRRRLNVYKTSIWRRRRRVSTGIASDEIFLA